MSNNTNKAVNKKIKQINWMIGLFVVLVIIGSILAQRASALTMSNTNYKLQMGTFEMSAGKSTNSNYKLSSATGTIPGVFTGPNYKVRAGFVYTKSKSSFAFSVSETLIDFGIISPTNPILRSTLLTVSKGSVSSYSVLASEDHPLTANNNLSIPDTTCDNSDCKEQTASPWTSILTYGFGYRCDNITGTDCSSNFLPPTYSNYYKQFSDTSRNETAVAVVSGAKGTNTQSKITYKLNISGAQAPGAYSNTITYLAVPTY
ncbi:MAG: hypothetical protein M1450_02625 [Patescibacteria group bacterium]|nr:hypothetical protein [Patescibacteria group bacterium]